MRAQTRKPANRLTFSLGMSRKSAARYRCAGPEKCTPDMKWRPPGPRTMALAMTVLTTVTMMPMTISENQPCMCGRCPEPAAEIWIAPTLREAARPSEFRRVLCGLPQRNSIDPCGTRQERVSYIHDLYRHPARQIT